MNKKFSIVCIAGIIAAGAWCLASCGKTERAASANTVSAAPQSDSVGVAKVSRKSLGRTLTLSSELVPFQEIEVYAKESGYVRKLSVDYGSRVKAGDVLAVLEIPELELQLQQDDATIKNASDQVTHAQHELSRVEAQHKVLHLQFDRLNGVAKSKPGLVAQQEVDDAQGKDLAAEAQIEASKSSLEAAQSQLTLAQTKRQHDQVLFDYSKITAPFSGVVTQRYANLGTLVQAGTSSSTQAMPLVRLSQDDLFRLVIPVPESYVRYIRVGDPVQVSVPSLNRTFPGKVTRFSVDVKEDTRTMHTEVDVPNPNHVLIPGLYAEAKITLENKNEALAVPLEAIDRSGDKTNVFVVNPSGKLELRQVTLGIQTPAAAEVISGVQDGDLVVVSDHSGLKAGEEVRPVPVQPVDYSEQDQTK
ncbi:MAG TPA: efflux RND transporter periplasmic adaptor subunit [Bryobacteraceae bacterium]|nr:efflux RND transporter periplasmic adaptor subunit [Bryobacteraceae bacterium]